MASAFLKEAIDNGNKVVIQTKLKDSRGKFGRVLGNVVVDGVNINQSMIDNYHAAAYFGQSKEAIEAVHDANRTRLIELGKFEPVE
jgi:endonuclease YncB( thermonuclease family)